MYKPKGSSHPMVRYLSHKLTYGLVQGGQENGTESIGLPNVKGIPMAKALANGRYFMEGLPK